MVDNRAARISKQPANVGKRPGWISKIVIFCIFVGIIAILFVFA